MLVKYRYSYSATTKRYHIIPFVLVQNLRQGVRETAAVNKNTSGTDCWPMIQVMIALESLWTGFCSPHAVSVDVILDVIKVLMLFYVRPRICRDCNDYSILRNIVKAKI